MPFNLARGHPNSSLLAKEEMQKLLQNLSLESNLSSVLQDGLQYGHEAGNPSFLRELELFLERQCDSDDYGELTSAHEHYKNHLFATMGVSHSLDLVCATLTNPGDVVMVECPTYFLVQGIFKMHRLRIQALPMRPFGQGVDVQALVQRWESGESKPPRVIYLIPTHQNPTAYTMSTRDRIELIRAAICFHVILVADEVYHCLDWRDLDRDGPRPARMAALSAKVSPSKQNSESDVFGACISIGSFTKIFGPGIRCGWVEASSCVINRLVQHGMIQSQGGCGPWVGEMMRIALENRLTDKALARLQLECKFRADKVYSILCEEPQIQVVNRPIGGYFVWIKFPDDFETDSFQEYCSDRIRFLVGTRCDVTTAPTEISSLHSHARLCFADLDPDELVNGVRQFLACFRKYCTKNKH